VIEPGPDRIVERGAPPIDFKELRNDLKQDVPRLLGKRDQGGDGQGDGVDGQ